jgi:hypothetical protein
MEIASGIVVIAGIIGFLITRSGSRLAGFWSVFPRSGVVVEVNRPSGRAEMGYSL